MKRCSRCKETKPPSEFYRSVGASGDLSCYCKPCKQAIRTEKREAFTYDFTPAELARFWGNIAAPDANGCMVWTNYKNDYGYGQFAVQNRQLGAHRIAWKIAGNELPVWPNVIDHTCRNRACCNVEHMRAVPQRVNSTENSSSPHAINLKKTHCPRGHEYSRGNTAIVMGSSKNGKPSPQRVCLTCWPNRWTWAVVERQAPNGSKRKWRGPAKLP